MFRRQKYDLAKKYEGRAQRKQLLMYSAFFLYKGAFKSVDKRAKLIGIPFSRLLRPSQGTVREDSAKAEIDMRERTKKFQSPKSQSHVPTKKPRLVPVLRWAPQPTSKISGLNFIGDPPNGTGTASLVLVN